MFDYERSQLIIGVGQSIAILLLGLALFVKDAEAFCGQPPSEVFTDWESGETAQHDWERGFTSDPAHVPPTATVPHPVTFMYPKSAPGPWRVRIASIGYLPTPVNCNGYLDAFGSTDELLIKPCPSHYPDIALHRVDGTALFSWWTWSQGPDNQCRVTSAIRHAEENGGDLSQGVIWEGTSFSGTGGMNNSMLLWVCGLEEHQQVVLFDLNIHHTLMVKNFPQFSGEDNPNEALAWEGLDRKLVDFRLRAADPDIQQHYYNMLVSASDTIVNSDFEVFDIMDAHDIAGFSMMHDAGHAIEPTPNIYTLPWTDPFTAPNMDWRLDRMAVAFSNASSDRVWCEGDPCDIGWHRLGLEYDMTGLYQDEVDEIAVDLRYNRWTNIGGMVPDQPESSTFDVTIRRADQFNPVPGESLECEFGVNGCTALVADDGDLHIRGLTLHYTDGWQALRIERLSL